MMTAKTHTLIEWEYLSSILYDTPFDDIELDVHITLPSQETIIVPTFWAGENKWKVRFIPSQLGTYHLCSVCTDTSNKSLHHINKTIDVLEEGSNTYASPIFVSENKQYLTQNNTPFFWLSDTWWMALSSRLTFPKSFKRLANKRKEQGFNVIQLVAGLFPDMDSFDKKCENEAGLPWYPDENNGYMRINPAYFDAADQRIAYLAQEGFTLCVLGAWGYYLEHMGIDKMKQHWRYIIARWGVYPTVWCAAGEAIMPYYLSENRNRETQAQKEGWTEIVRYIKEIDPFGHLITIHPTEVGTAQLTDASLLDINLLQASHQGYGSVEKSITLLENTIPKSAMPVIMDEVNYEGILQDTHAAIQRLTFWTAILSGSKGYGYGANGIWQVNTRQNPFGASPHGATWGDTPWEDAFMLSGAQHISLAKKLLVSIDWHTLTSQQSYLHPHADVYEARAPRIAGIDERLRIVYFYAGVAPWDAHYSISHLNTNLEYSAYFWNPSTAQKHLIHPIKVSTQGTWKIPALPTLEDWVIVLEATEEKYVKEPSEKKVLHTLKQWFKEVLSHV